MPSESNVTPLHSGIAGQAASAITQRAHLQTANRRALQSERSPITVPRGMVPLGGYGTYSTRELARMCGVSISTAKSWRRKGKAPGAVVIMLELLHRGPLEVISHEWADWAIRNGRLCNNDGHEYTPGEVWAIPILYQRIAALEATNRQLSAKLEDFHREMNDGQTLRANVKAIGKAEALCRVVFALLSELTSSEDDSPPVLDGNSALVRRVQLATCQVAIALYQGGSCGTAASDAEFNAALAQFIPALGELPDGPETA